MSLSGNAAKMEGTAVTADELWTLGEGDDPLAGLPNAARPTIATSKAKTTRNG